MTLPFHIPPLYTYLQEKMEKVTLDSSTQQISFSYPLKEKEQEISVFLSIRAPSDLLDIVAFLPFTIDPSEIKEIGLLLHLLNHEFDMPGFGVDLKQTLFYYRLVLPCIDKKIEKKLLHMYLGTARVACAAAMQTLHMMATQNMTGSEAFQQVAGRRA